MQLRGMLILVPALALSACGGDDNDGNLVPDSGVKPDSGPGADAGTDGGLQIGEVPDPADLSWNADVVEQGANSRSIGDQLEIARAPNGTIGLVYFRTTGQDEPDTCELFGAPPQTLKRVEIVYAELQADGSWTTELAAETDAIGQQGLSIAFDSSNNPAIAFMGGPDSMYRCGASDLMLAQRSGGRWNVRSLVDAGAAPTVFDEDATRCADAQDYCNVGNTVGEWPSLLFEGNTPAVAYRDIHNAFNQDDELRSDLELMRGGQRLALDAPWGGGKYASLAFRNGNPVVAHANRADMDRIGIWVSYNDGSEWQRKRLTNDGDTGARLRLGVFGDRMSVVHHDEADNKLIYHESTDGQNWVRTVIDQTGNTGRSPSMTFDGVGNPVIAYRHCGDFDPNNTECEMQKDLVRIRIRKGTSWKFADLPQERMGLDGVFVAVTLDEDALPVIAYKAGFIDTASGEGFSQVRVARGTLTQ